MSLFAPQLVLLVGTVMLMGCIQTVKGRPTPELSQVGAIQRVAVLPFSIGPPLSRESAGEPASGIAERSRSGQVSPDAAAKQVGHQVAQSLQQRQVAVVAPADVKRALLAAGLSATGEKVEPAKIGRVVHAQFGADAFLMGEVHRFQEREGRPAGATRPAAVGFQVWLYDAPGGKLLWTGTVDERQKPLSANVFDASRYPGHGFRWLSVDELAAWCAGRAAQAIPLNR